MRVGVFGGTFDPVHLGHLILAEQCREQARLDRVLFVPAALPPHKREQALTPFAQRVEMLTLAISGHSAFRVEELEKDRIGPSFTVDTLAHLQHARPGDDLFFILGSDSLRDLPLWYEPRRILELATLLIVERPDALMMPEPTLKGQLRLEEDFALRMQAISSPLVAIASRDIRQRIASRRSVRYLIPRAVEAYIQDKGLYQNQTEPEV
ncbi:MAG: nicotinate (nicotinamide) nucleotide adenylyltransferase [Planctomycetes bacterium]|nr:nicotinate (nicotinamide) nucleotide adenylyltransferase [Planctomycetota bacterium]